MMPTRAGWEALAATNLDKARQIAASVRARLEGSLEQAEEATNRMIALVIPRERWPLGFDGDAYLAKIPVAPPRKLTRWERLRHWVGRAYRKIIRQTRRLR